MNYEIFNNPPRIKCLQCDRTSYNIYDVNQRYCGFCHKFHSDSPVVLSMRKMAPEELQQWLDDLTKLESDAFLRAAFSVPSH